MPRGAALYDDDDLDYQDYDDDYYDEDEAEEYDRVVVKAPVPKKTVSKPTPAPSNASSSLAQSMKGLSVSQPISSFSSTLTSRPAPAQVSIKASTSQTVSKPIPEGFKGPSPDDAVFEARKRKPRAAETAPVAAASSTTTTTKVAAAGTTKPTPKSDDKPAVKKALSKKEVQKEQRFDEEDARLKPLLSVIVVGHIDAGKSTLTGHLLVDLKIVTSKIMHKLESDSKTQGKASFKYAWVMDAHDEERKRGVTVDVGVSRFETESRRVVLLDAPGHKDFIPNLLAGATQADSAIWVVPATSEFEDVFHADTNETWREHVVLMSRLGCAKLIVAVNKMDSVSWSQDRFKEIQTKCTDFAVEAAGFPRADVVCVPVSGLTGENLVEPGKAEWVRSSGVPTLLRLIDGLPPAQRPTELPTRFVVSDAYKKLGAVVLSGKLEAGFLREASPVWIAPLGITSKIKSLTANQSGPVGRVKAGDHVEVVLTDLDEAAHFPHLTPGAVLCDPTPETDKVSSTSSFQAEVFTLRALRNKATVLVYLHSKEILASVEILEVMGAKSTKIPLLVRPGHRVRVRLQLKSEDGSSPLACVDTYGALSRVVVRNEGVTLAAGSVTGL